MNRPLYHKCSLISYMYPTKKEEPMFIDSLDFINKTNSYIICYIHIQLFVLTG